MQEVAPNIIGSLGSATQQIVSQLRGKKDASSVWSVRDIVGGGKHFDWYFPNLALNQNVENVNPYGDFEQFAGVEERGIIYDKNLITSLIQNKDYRDNYLALTKKYFTSAGLIKENGDAGDPAKVNYNEIKGHLVRLNKIIQSYRILMVYSEKLKGSDTEIDGFLQDLKDTYKKVYGVFKGNKTEFEKTLSAPGGYGLSSVQQCFENDIDKMIFDESRDKNTSIRELTKKRQIATDVFDKSKTLPHLTIESEIDSRQELKNRTKGAIYGQAILDALGLTTEFLGRKQAKVLLRDSGVLALNGDYKVSIPTQELYIFKTLPYETRKQEGLYISNEIKALFNTSKGRKGDDRSDTARAGAGEVWRQIVPKGSFTDDTDQAVLKFKALKDAHGDLEQAKQNYAKDIKKWKENQLKEYFGKNSFGLGDNTKSVIEDGGFLGNPIATSEKIWQQIALSDDEKGYKEPHFVQANGALMSSSYILQYYPDDLEKAQKATVELAKVTHYDPLVSAHCVAYITMLYHLQHHEGKVSDERYKEYLDQSYQAGKRVFDERKHEYDRFRASDSWKDGKMDAKIAEWETQMQKAIHGEIKKADGVVEKFNSWEDLNLVDPQIEKDGNGSPDYDNIGMSHRALSAGFFGLKQLHEKIKTGKDKKDAFAEICIELMAQGGDADTNGTVVGSLCGSYVGFDGIEKSLIDGLGAGDKGRKVGKVGDGRGGFHEIQEKKLLEEIVQSSQQKIGSIAPIRNPAYANPAYANPAYANPAYATPAYATPANTAAVKASNQKQTDLHDDASSSSSFKGDEDWEVNPKFIIGGILAGAGIGVCVSALTVGIVFSAPAVATMTAGVALGGLAGYTVGTIVKNATAENVKNATFAENFNQST
jgi:ADP-ribosylglycohydrolase